MIVHLHTLCWNDAPMLEFFFRHYEGWVDHFFIDDDQSDDGTREMLEARSDVTVTTMTRSDSLSWVLSAKHYYDTCWLRSRGEADWIVITNIDEHLWHPDWPSYLARCTATGLNAIGALGFQMIADRFPPAESTLTLEVPRGAPWRRMSRLDVFAPAAFDAIDHGPGRHAVDVDGALNMPERDEVLNLHYKYLGVPYVMARHAALRSRLGPGDRERGWGHKYDWDRSRLEQDFERVRSQSSVVADSGAGWHDSYPFVPRWRW